MKQASRFYKYLFCTSFVLMIYASCSTNDPIEDLKSPQPVETPEDKIEYYVKYQSDVSIPSSNLINIHIAVTTEKGKQSLSVPRGWEGIFGPFNELTTLTISAKADGSWNPNMTSCRGRISICRGNQPFILKADKSFKGTSYTVSYTVVKDDLN